MAVRQSQRAGGAEGADADALPVLWHLKVSHYNEKARWALDHKRVPHLRRALLPGAHRAVARKLTGGATFPIVVLDGEAIGDSTRIIAALERRHPDPPLYPSDPDARRRALELEDFFDEELGPHLRLIAMHHMLADADLFLGAFAPDLTRPRRLFARATFARVRRQVTATMGIDEAAVERAYRKVRAAGRRFGVELEPSGYLVGEAFSVADLTLAALVSPAAAPERFPYPQPQRGHPLLDPLRDALTESGLLQWALDIYERHRSPSAEVVASDARGRGK